MLSGSVSLEEGSAGRGGDGLRFDVFLSHNSRDKPLVERLAERLKRERLEPWLDAWQLVPGATWQEGIAEGLAGSRSCAVFVGPGDVGDWENQEVAVALDRAATDPDFRLFLVLLPGLPERFDASTLSPFLRLRTWVDYRGGLDDERAFRAFVGAIHGLPPGPEVPVEDTGRCPYRGLEAFDEEHADFFFGRQADVQRLVEKLKGTRFLAVLGASGSGKSSLARAGLVPELKSGNDAGGSSWEVIVFRPGAHPLEALAAQLVRLGAGQPIQQALDALALDSRTLHLASTLVQADRPEGRLVLIVDQFEEVFTLCRDEAERVAFFANLVYGATIPGGRCWVLPTMRADFYHRCGEYPELAQQFAAAQYLVSPLQPEGLRQAVEEPARLVGLDFERGLVATILEDVADQPGALPLLEHALLEIWRRRSGGLLTLAGYTESGGVQGALAKRAEQVFGSLDPYQQELARRAFLRLSQPGEGAEDTRRRAPVSELEGTGADEAFGVVLSRLVDARLLTASRDERAGAEVVEVAHEALIRGWPRLRDWIDADRAGLRVHRRLTEAAREWQRLERDQSALFRGTRLAEAIEWRADNEESLNELEDEFLVASSTAERNEIARARRRTRVLRALVATLAVLLVAAVAAAALAKRRTDEANAQRDEAMAQRELVLARALVTRAEESLATSPDLAMLLSLEALRAVRDHPLRSRFAARDGALRSLQHNARLEAVLHAPAGDVAISPDGKMLAATGADRRLRVWDLDARRLIGIPYGVEAFEVAFSGDGRSLAVATGEGARVGTVGQPETFRALGRSPVHSITFGPDGRLATVGPSGVSIWDVGREKRLAGPFGGASVVHLAWSGDGRALAVASANGTLRVWDAERGAQRGQSLRVNGDRGPYLPSTLAFADDGRILVAAGADGKVRLWSFPGLAPQRTMELGGALRGREVSGVTFYPPVAVSPDGRTIAVGTYDGVIRLWDIDGRLRAREPLLGHEENVVGLAFTPDGRTLVSAGADDTIRIWDVRPEQPLSTTMRGDIGHVTGIAFSPDGRLLASAGSGLRLWDVARREMVAVLQESGAVEAVAFSPDARTLASAGGPSVQIWDVVRRKPLSEPLRNPSGSVTDLAFSADGKTLATADGDANVRFWNVADGKPTPLDETLRHAGQRPLSALVRIAFSPDGRVIATAAEDVQLWDVAGRERIGRLRHTGETGVSALGPIAFGAGGRLLASAEYPGQVQVWDVARQRPLGNPLQRGLGLRSSMAFSPDGQTLAVPGHDGTLLLWDADSREPVGDPLRGHRGYVSAVAFSPDSATLASASAEHEGTRETDRTIRLWDPIVSQSEFETWRQRLCRVVRRSMSATEWRQAMPDETYRRTCPRFGPPSPPYPRVGP